MQKSPPSIVVIDEQVGTLPGRHVDAARRRWEMVGK
jgi:hypothetical protein